jgi:hypothetical protein
MGRDSRQARRARERREAEARRRGKSTSSNSSKWGIIAAVAVVAAAIVLFVTATLTNAFGTKAKSTTPPEAPGRVVDGIIHCNAGMENGTVYHIHQHLTMYDKGKQVNLPALIGFNYNHDCLYWTHTHDTSGIIHIESPHQIKVTLGNFFDVWGKPLNTSRIGTITVQPQEQIKTWVNMKPYSGSLRSIDLKRHTQIVIEVGPPFVKPKSFTFPAGV